MFKRLFAALLAVATLTSCAHTPKFAGPFGADDTTSIAALEPVTLGGARQWMLIRGKNRANPVLMLIHGGPGGAEMSLVRHYLSALENDFVVVTYDIRGAGKSYPIEPPGAADPTVEQCVSDAEELVALVRRRMERPKIFLAANSWGTILGTLLAQRHPEWFEAYIGISQWTDGAERELASYQLVLDWAKRTKNEEAERQLQAIGPPPFSGPDGVARTEIQKSWLARSGGVIHGVDHLGPLMIPLFTAAEYSLPEKLRFMDGVGFSMRKLWQESMQIDLRTRVPSLAVPVYFVSGRHDWNIPVSEVKRYFDALEAPSKELVVFDHSAHLPHYEEPDRFVEFLRSKVLRKR